MPFFILDSLNRRQKPTSSFLQNCSKVTPLKDDAVVSVLFVFGLKLCLIRAAASIGSGVENPQLELANPVTFQNNFGLTYKGKVVAIDPKPYEGFPRGRVRVKYNDWPDDK